MKQKQKRYVDEIVDDGKPWYAVRLFSTKLAEDENYFKENGLESFIPMQYVDEEDAKGKLHHRLKPVVRNLIFIKQTISDKEFKSMVFNSNQKISVLTKSDDSRSFYLIPHDQMYEFRLMCNPEIAIKKFISTDEAKMKAGDPVYVKFGPLKGMRGRLVRSSKKYYLLSEIPGISVMMKVSRWCCVPEKQD